jgi:nitroreductase
MEAGHAAQNLLLQAVALGLGAVVMGAFGDAEVRAAAALRGDERPLYLIPVGRPR